MNQKTRFSTKIPDFGPKYQISYKKYQISYQNTIYQALLKIPVLANLIFKNTKLATLNCDLDLFLQGFSKARPHAHCLLNTPRGATCQGRVEDFSRGRTKFQAYEKKIYTFLITLFLHKRSQMPMYIVQAALPEPKSSVNSVYLFVELLIRAS